MKPLLIILAAGLWLVARPATGQVLIANALDGTNTGPTTLTATVGTTNSANLGPGWTASNTFVGVLSSQTLTLDGGTANDAAGLFRIAQAGVTGVAGSFTASKVFTGVTLLDNTTYNLTIDGNSTTTVSLLSSMSVEILLGTEVVYTAPSATLLGLINQTATESFVFSFTTGDVANATDVGIRISGNTLAAALGQSASLTEINLSVSPVPEPGSLLLMMVGCAAVLRRARPRPFIAR